MAKYKAYPEYKDSGVEWLKSTPAHWSSAPIKYLALATNSLFLDGDWIESKDISDDGVRYITTGNVGEGLYKEQGSGFITENTFSKLNCTEVFEGDILISRLNNPIGRACLVPSLGYKTVTSVDNVIFRTDKYYNRKYLVYLFSSKDYFQHTGNLARGTTMQRISRGLLGNIRIPVPTRSEQASIAAFLDHETAKIDNLIEKQLQLIELLKEKRQAVISYAVTKGLNPDVPMKDSGVEWLGEVPAHWTVTRLGNHAIKIGSGKTPRGGSEIYLDEGVLFLRSQNIYDDGLRVGPSECVFIDIKTHNEMKGTRVLEGDILLNITGGSIGRSCIVPTPFAEANVNQHVCILRFTENIREFISYAMKSSSTKEQIEACQVGGNREGLNFEQTSKINICLPPEEEIGAVLGYLKIRLPQLDTLEKNAANIILLLQERRTALISAAVTGKIDVRDWVAPDTQDVEESEEANA